MSTPEHFKGKKVRAWGPWHKFLEMIGAAPLAVPHGEQYMALKLGTIDGTLTAGTQLENQMLKEVVTAYLDHDQPCTNCTLINLDSFNALPEDIKYMITTYTPLWLTVGSLELYEHEAYIIGQVIRDYDFTLYKWSDEDYGRVKAQCIDELWPEFAQETPLCAQLVEIIKQQHLDHGR